MNAVQRSESRITRSRMAPLAGLDALVQRTSSTLVERVQRCLGAALPTPLETSSTVPPGSGGGWRGGEGCGLTPSNHPVLFRTANDQIAAALGTARRTLERRFQADLGQSPGRIYLEIRLDRAVARLHRTKQSVTEIALACGFCDAPHLARALKAERGVSPGEIRAARGSEAARVG